MPTQLYFPRRQQEGRTLRDESKEFTDLIMQMQLRDYLRKQQLADAIELAKEKAKIQSPTEEALSQLYGAYAKKLLGRGAEDDAGLPDLDISGLGKLKFKTDKAAPKITAQDLKNIQQQIGLQVAEEHPFPKELGEIRFGGEEGNIPQRAPGFGRFLDVISPFATPTEKLLGRIGKQREERGLELYKPYLEQTAAQFKVPTAGPAVQPGTIMGKFTGGVTEGPARNPQIEQRIAEARAQGISDKEIASDLREVGIDPGLYGLK